MRVLVCVFALIFVGCGQELLPACRTGQVASAAPASPSTSAGFHLYGHAHNDYEHDRPLLDALDHHFYSVEADLWYDGGKLTVSHLGIGAKGTLDDLYLKPLQQRVDATGSVHGDGVQFTLWLDLKENHEGFDEALNTLLNSYSMLTRIDGDVVTDGPVRVVLTGDKTAKEGFVDTFSSRRAFRDSNDYTPDDPAADAKWRFYALDWKKYLAWNGDGALPGEDEARLSCIVANSHSAGREVRFYNSPDKTSGWQALVGHGVDFVHTDNLAGLDTFLEGL